MLSWNGMPLAKWAYLYCIILEKRPCRPIGCRCLHSWAEMNLLSAPQWHLWFAESSSITSPRFTMVYFCLWQNYHDSAMLGLEIAISITFHDQWLNGSMASQGSGLFIHWVTYCTSCYVDFPVTQNVQWMHYYSNDFSAVLLLQVLWF